MGLLDRIFGNGKEGEPAAGPAAGASTQFHESEPDSQDSRHSRNAPRRELLQVVLRDTMRKHGIPSDWIDCRILSSMSRSGRTGLHLNFVVRKDHEKLLAYVFAFQVSFERELARYEPRARDWLLSLGWEFQGFNPDEMPNPREWAASGPAPLVQPDWKGPSPSSFGELEPEAPKSDEDMQRDLAALFAIRDAAMADTVARTKEQGAEDGGFQETQPADDSDPPRKS
ncbi:MAG TPA: hypothetical protein VHL79_19650 [Ramlibacter sp.]|jgi:hypothetical protein|nr:hypothetical protein [Ramlibacter sp.]